MNMMKLMKQAQEMQAKAAKLQAELAARNYEAEAAGGQIKAVATGSGGSTQFGIRAPWMAERRFLPQQGSAAGLAHYLDTAKDMASEAGVATDLIDCLIDVFARAADFCHPRDRR